MLVGTKFPSFTPSMMMTWSKERKNKVGALIIVSENMTNFKVIIMHGVKEGNFVPTNIGRPPPSRRV